MATLSASTLRAYEMLSPDQKIATDHIIRAHIAACRKQGIPVESMDRVWFEAMEQVRLDGVLTPQSGESASHEPRRRYDVYTTPRDLD